MIGKEAAEKRLYMQRVCGDWNISPYAYCSLRCAYCSMDSQGRSRPMLTEREIDTLLRQRLRAVQPPQVLLGTVTDIYPEEEEKYRLSRALLEMLSEENVYFKIVTKNDMVLRDIDILRESKCTVTISAGITDEGGLKRLEPRVPSFARRIEALMELHEAGVECRLSACPWIPGLSDSEKIINAVGGKFPITFGSLILFDYIAPLYEEKGYTAPSVMRNLGKRLKQEEIDLAYLEEAQNWLDCPNVSWFPPRGIAKNMNLPHGGSGLTRDNIKSYIDQTNKRGEMPEGRGEMPSDFTSPVGSAVACVLRDS